MLKFAVRQNDEVYRERAARARAAHNEAWMQSAETLMKIEAGRDLSRAEAEAVMEELLEGRLQHEEIVALLRGLRAKGEAVEELVGFARAMRRHARPVSAADASVATAEPLADTCG